MTNRFAYKYGKFSSGKRKGEVYCSIINVKTGKTIKTVSSEKALQKVKKSVTGQKYRGKKRLQKEDVIKRMDEESAGGTYKQYEKMYKTVYKEMEIKNKKGEYKTRTGRKVNLTAAQLRSRAKRVTIEHRTGVVSKYRYAWVYWQVIGKDAYGDLICDSTPVFEADALKRNGAEDYPTMVDVCMDVYNKIRSGIESEDIYNKGDYKVQGGLCVTLSRKTDKKVLAVTARGDGCGTSIDFEGYDKTRVF